MRSMFVEFPDDQTCRTLDRQYMFGPSLLVAPVFTYSGEVSYYLPDGMWTNWLTGERANGGMWRNETHGYDSVPLWVPDGSIIVTNPGQTKPDRVYGEHTLVSVFLDEVASAHVVVSEIDGASVEFTARRTDRGVEVASSDGRAFSARLGSTGPVVQAQGGSVLL
jgi:alpha-D-xyloside xylohydrolase